jgi:outer membrane protein assembly factor BamE (lipoprotein component of BamABCDE complex)
MKTFVLLVLAAAVWVFVIYTSAQPKPGNTEDTEKSQVIRDAIAYHRLIIGMTREQVIASWGRPSAVQKRETEEEFDYSEGNNAFLDNGVLSSFNQTTMPTVMKKELSAAAVVASQTPQQYPGGLKGTDLDQKAHH